MGTRGPAPTPTSQLKLRGSWRGDTRDGEPDAPAGKPQMPKWMDAEAKKYWARVVVLLEKMGLLSQADEMVLMRYVVMLARWVKAEKFVQKHGTAHAVWEQILIPDPDKPGDMKYERRLKYMRRFPQVGEAHELHQALLRVEQHYGLTPSARAAIGAAIGDGKKTKAANDYGRFFGDTAG